MQQSQHPSSIIWYLLAIYFPCYAWPLWTALLLNDRRFSESVQYGKHLLRPLPLPDSITFTLSYLTANHPLPSLFTLSLLSLFLLLLFPLSLYLNHCPPSLALWTNSSVTFNHKQFKKAFLHPPPSSLAYNFSLLLPFPYPLCNPFWLLRTPHVPIRHKALTQSVSNSEASRVTDSVFWRSGGGRWLKDVW